MPQPKPKRGRQPKARAPRLPPIPEDGTFAANQANRSLPAPAPAPALPASAPVPVPAPANQVPEMISVEHVPPSMCFHLGIDIGITISAVRFNLPPNSEESVGKWISGGITALMAAIQRVPAQEAATLTTFWSNTLTTIVQDATDDLQRQSPHDQVLNRMYQSWPPEGYVELSPAACHAVNDMFIQAASEVVGILVTLPPFAVVDVADTLIQAVASMKKAILDSPVAHTLPIDNAPAAVINDTINAPTFGENLASSDIGVSHVLVNSTFAFPALVPSNTPMFYTGGLGAMDGMGGMDLGIQGQYPSYHQSPAGIGGYDEGEVGDN